MTQLALWLGSLVATRRGAWTVVGLVAVLSAGAVPVVAGLVQEDDLLAFLPERSTEVRDFLAIAERYGSVDIALVGVEASSEPLGVFAPDFLRALKKATAELKSGGDLAHVLSLSNTADFVSEGASGGVVTSTLIDPLPSSDAEAATLRDKVMSRDAVVGNLVSHDGRAVVIYAHLAHGQEPRQVAQRITAVMEKNFAPAQLYLGGAPFVQSYVYDTTQRDLARLTPWAVLLIVVIMALAFGRIGGALVVVVTASLSVLLTLAAMTLAGEPLNIVLSATPIVLFALGTEYGVHWLSRFEQLAAEMPRPEAIRATMRETGSVVVMAALTTVAGLGSFAVMDIRPVRVFGIVSGLGVLVCMVLSLTLIPAAVSLGVWRGAAPATQATTHRWLVALGRGVFTIARRRRLIGGGLLAVCLLGAVGTTSLDSRVDLTTFFSPSSPPARAEEFLRNRFGGASLLLVDVAGDMNEPLVLRRLRGLADELSLVPGVSRVLHIGEPISLSGKALTGAARIPDTREQVGALYSFIDPPLIAPMLAGERDHALVIVRLSGADLDAIDASVDAAEAVLARLPWALRPTPPGAPTAAESLRQETALGLRALLHSLGKAVPAQADVADALAAATDGKADRGRCAELLGAFLASDESAVPLAPAVATSIADRLAKLGVEATAPLSFEVISGELAAVGVAGADAEVLAFSLETVVADTIRQARAEARLELILHATDLELAADGAEGRLRERAAALLMDLDAPTVGAPVQIPPTAPDLVVDANGPAAGATPLPMSAVVSGLPIVYRGMSRSINQNQVASMGLATLLCWVVLAWFLRSVWAGLLACVPTLVTLLVIYGFMGAAHIHLDIGSSMIGSIVLGAAVDYAAHMLAAWRSSEKTVEASARNAAREAGGAVLVSSFIIAAGFFVLTLGEAKPLKNVGLLTTAAMLVSGISVFFTLPVLARRSSYGGSAAHEDSHMESDR